MNPEPCVAKKHTNRDLQKTRLCVLGRNGRCRYGAGCTFAHSSLELRTAPDLRKTQLCSEYMEGSCVKSDCDFAHGEEELREKPNFKKKPCKWYSKGLCRHGVDCGFVHGAHEMRADPLGSSATNYVLAPPPGLSIPDQHEQRETQLQEEPLQVVQQRSLHFQFAAGRGTAPLEQQVASISSAIVGLQLKIAQLENMGMHAHVAHMHQSIEELSKKCQGVESTLGTRLNAHAKPFLPTTGWASDDSTSVGSSE